jgi:hypothetical protein
MQNDYWYSDPEDFQCSWYRRENSLAHIFRHPAANTENSINIVFLKGILETIITVTYCISST